MLTTARAFRLGRPAACVLLLTAAAAMAGTDVLVDGNPNTIQNEIDLTLIPGQPARVAMAYNDSPYSGPLGIAHSADSGATWSLAQLSIPSVPLIQVPPLPPPPPTVPMGREFDPTITADTQGNLFAACIADGANNPAGNPLGGYDSGLYAFKSTDYGASWGAPVQVSYDGPTMVPAGEDPAYRYNDRCRVRADTYAASPYTDNVYVTWIRDRGLLDRSIPGRLPTSDIYFSRSTDGGATFSAPAMVNDPNHSLGNIPLQAVAPDGTIYLAWLDYNVWTAGQGQIYLRKSTDGGATFPAWDPNSADHPVAQIALPPVNLTTGAGASEVYTKANSGTPIAVAPNDPNTVYIAYAADPDGAGADEADVFLIRSTDGGQTWGNPLRVNDDATVTDQAFPWLAVKPDGTIDVAWYDKRRGPLDDLWDVFIARSVDGGLSFLPNLCLSDASAPAPANNWLGEYLGLAVDGTYAYCGFTSSSLDASNGDVWFDRVRNSDIGESPVIPEPASILCVLSALAAGGGYLCRRLGVANRSQGARKCP